MTERTGVTATATRWDLVPLHDAIETAMTRLGAARGLPTLRWMLSDDGTLLCPVMRTPRRHLRPPHQRTAHRPRRRRHTIHRPVLARLEQMTWSLKHGLSSTRSAKLL